MRQVLIIENVVALNTEQNGLKAKS